ncbi:MAG: ABC transporter permease [Terriglobales bacterium]
METLIQDVRYGLRMLWKSPGFTTVAILTLALGIGANTAMFSVINSVLLHSLPFRDPARVMVVWKTMSNGQPNAFSTPAFLEMRQQGDVLAHMGVYSGVSYNLAGEEVPERVAGGKINADLLPVLGVQPALGRSFADQEDHPGAGNFVILSHALWQTRFEAIAGILGKPITLNGTPYTVVGVMPRGFHVLSDKELFWVPLQLETANAAASARNVHWMFAFIRLAPGMTQKRTETVLETYAARLKKQDPNGEGGLGVTLLPISEFLNGNVKPVLLLLMGAVAFVLLIACSNVANLLLARGTIRRREMSIRTALGAARGRVIAQLLTESVLLSALGGALGLALAWAAVQLLVAIHPSSIPSVETVGIDATVLGYTALLCGVVGILFGVFPALEASRVNVSEALKEGARGSSGGFGKHRMALVITETALASILLIGAGLSLKSLWRTESVDPGFNPTGEMTFRIGVPAQYKGERIPVFYQQVMERVQAVPGVQSAVLARNLPMSGTDPSMAIAIEGTPPPPDQIPIVTRFRAVGPGYFNGLEIQLRKGREFNDHDTTTAPRVAVVSESLAKLYWPKEDAIGKRIKPEVTGGEWYTVVGVANDVRHWTADVTDVEPTAYYPYTQVPEAFLPVLEDNMSVAVRSANSAGILSSIRAAVAEVDATVPVYGVKAMDEMVADAGSLRRFDMWLIGTFATLALALAAIGIYGVMAYSVSQRTREIGIRVALGAQPGTILQLVMKQGAGLAAIGVLVGVVGAFGLTRLMESLLFGVSSRDLATFSLVPVIVLGLILVGCFIPAYRATKLDPLEALREE